MQGLAAHPSLVPRGAPKQSWGWGLSSSHCCGFPAPQDMMGKVFRLGGQDFIVVYVGLQFQKTHLISVGS